MKRRHLWRQRMMKLLQGEIFSCFLMLMILFQMEMFHFQTHNWNRMCMYSCLNKQGMQMYWLEVFCLQVWNSCQRRGKIKKIIISFKFGVRHFYRFALLFLIIWGLWEFSFVLKIAILSLSDFLWIFFHLQVMKEPFPSGSTSLFAASWNCSGSCYCNFIKLISEEVDAFRCSSASSRSFI